MTLFVFSPAKKFVFFCNCGVIPICFCSSPGRPFRKILIRMCFFHSRNISTDFARDLVICRTIDKCKGSIHLGIIPLTLLLSPSFLFPALPFRLLSGSEKVVYMTIRQLEVHARTYSSSYRARHPLPIPDTWKGPDLYGIGIGWQAGWSAMATKTVLKQLLRKWGPLSTEMQEAIESDEEAIGADGNPVEAGFEEVPEEIGWPDEEPAAEMQQDAAQAQQADAADDIEALFAAGAGA